MKILHIYDIAGVAYVLSKWQNKAGHNSDVINQFDAFGYHDFYGGIKVDDPEECAQTIERIAPEYNILHVHSVYQILPRIARFKKPIVMHYHGSDVMREDPFRKHCEQYAKLMLVSNEYLLKYQPKAKWLPNPVDAEHFYRRRAPITDYALQIRMPYLEGVEEGCDESRMVMVWDRESNPKLHEDMPDVLSQYSRFIDIKYHKEWGLLPALSKTGLEALACGLRVLNWKKEWIEGLPEQHRPENVVKQLDQFYSSLVL